MMNLIDAANSSTTAEPSLLFRHREVGGDGAARDRDETLPTARLCFHDRRDANYGRGIDDSKMTSSAS